MIEFVHPMLLLLALLAIPLFIVMLRPAGRMKFSGFGIWPNTGRSFRARTSFIPALLLALAFAALCVAAAGPRVPGESKVREHREGISMMLVVDKSGSMEALDMATEDEPELNRLEALKKVIGEFVEGNGNTLSGRYDDAIGLVSFASYPDSDCPLTLDHATLMELVDDIQIAERNESGTAIGDALGLAGERLRENQAKSKVIVLLTDGVNNTGYEAPLDAARMVADLGIKIYTIGIGTNGTALMPTIGFFGRKTVMPVPVEIDEKTLTKIAELSGGEYFRATDNESLHHIYEKIDALEKSKISEDRYMLYDEKYANFVVLALLLAAAGMLLRVTYYRRMPW